MKSILIAIGFLILSGCSTTVPVKVKFPDAPKTLMEPAPSLKLLDESQKQELSDLLENTAENASRYYELREKYKNWQKWYQEQRKLFEEVQPK